MNEQSLVQLYMNLTGTTEACARSVFMYLDSAPKDLGQQAEPSLLSPEDARLSPPREQ